MKTIREQDLTEQRMTDREKAIVQVATVLYPGRLISTHPTLGKHDLYQLVHESIGIVDACLEVARSPKGGAA